MNKIIFFGSDLHNEPSELASKIVRSLKPSFKDSMVLSIENRKIREERKDTIIVPKLSKNRIIRIAFQSLILPFYFAFLRIKGYNKIASFWTVHSSYHYFLFKYLKILRFKIYFSVISGYDKDYSALRYCDVIICQSNRMLKFIKNSFPKSEIILIHPGVNLNVFKPGKKDNLIVIPSVPYLVSLFHERGIDKILYYLKENKNVKYKIITRSEEAARFISSQLGGKNVIGKTLTNGEMSRIMSRAKVVPLLYKDSPDMPLSAIEGLASGAAIVCSDNMGLADYVKDNECGLVYSNDSNELKKRDIEKILKTARFNKKARELAVRLFDEKDMTERYKSALGD